jgi:predicted HNH restriction endonuclease
MKKKKPVETDEAKIKRNFRASKVWKEFRLSFIKEYDARCSCCGVKKYGKERRALQLHHHNDDIKTYKDVHNRENFTLLCAGCHKLVERFLSRRKGEFDIDDWFIKFKKVYEASRRGK